MQLSVKDFAALIGQSESAATAMEDGSKTLTVKELTQIAQKTHTTLFRSNALTLVAAFSIQLKLASLGKS